MRIIAVGNQKGGVGKTALAFHLIRGLVERGFSVLVIDLDPQGHLSATFRRQDRCSALHIFDDDPRISIEHVEENLDLVASNVELAKVETRVSLESFVKLRKALRKVTGYRYVIVDCPPSLGLLTANALCAADAILVPVTPSYFSIRALEDLHGLIESVREEGFNPGIAIGGIVMNFVERTLVAREAEEVLRERYGNVLYHTKIPKSVRVEEALQEGIPVWKFAPDTSVARAFLDFVGEFLCREGIEHGP